jgi:hypothetical protein
MARLIPAIMDDHTPPGERDVFNMLSAGPDDWVALHSLDLAPWNRSLRTEIDFVIIVPDIGIICVEVKSHEWISFDNDRWSPSTIKRSPFKQASDGSHTFYRRLRELAPHLSTVPVVPLCIFPRANFDLQPNLSVHPWELIDGRSFRLFSCGHDLCNDLRGRIQKSITADKNLQPLSKHLSQGVIEEIVAFCLPVQKRRPDVRAEILHREEEAERILRAQQKPVLMLAALNDRLIVSGGAGTGKTLIAMEVARRAASQGKRVALLCFNQLVGDWLKRQMERNMTSFPNLVAGRAIKVMTEMSGLIIPQNPSKEFWENDLPERLEEHLTDPDFRAVASFDYLVLDEAQDILSRPRLWQCISQFLSGGVEKGKFALFGDFDNQVLGERSIMEQTLAELGQLAKPSRWQLSENCRNYPIVGNTALRLSGFDCSVYSGFMRTGGSIQNYDISFYTNEGEQQERLGQYLREFKSIGYKPSEIVVLSFSADETCAAVRLRDSGFRLRPVWQSGDCTGYSSVHAFKGMESKVVILTDLVLGQSDFQRHLFYTGMTRATESVRVLCHENSMTTLLEWLSGKEQS